MGPRRAAAEDAQPILDTSAQAPKVVLAIGGPVMPVPLARPAPFMIKSRMSLSTGTRMAAGHGEASWQAGSAWSKWQNQVPVNVDLDKPG